MTIEAGDITLRILRQPPPHLVFLSSQMDAEKDTASTLAVLARMGGLASLVVREIDGEEVVYESGRMPRTLAELESAGRGFTMAAFDRVGSYEGLAELYKAILTAYQTEDGAPNPT